MKTQKLYNLVADGWGDPDGPVTLAELRMVARNWLDSDNIKSPIVLRENHLNQIIDDNTYEVIAELVT